MDSDRLRELLADPQAFFADTHNFVFVYFLIIFGVFTVARVARVPQSTAVPVAMALFFIVVLLQNGMIPLNGPFLFFAAIAVVAVVLGIRHLQRYIQHR